MTDLNPTVTRDFTRYYQESAQKIHGAGRSALRRADLDRPYPYGNSIGHLMLHLTGNLNYYIGAEIGGTGYVRNRPLEFAETSRHSERCTVEAF